VNVLKIEYVATDDLIPYINNSRTHSESQVKQIAASISEFGFTNPILIDEQNTVIAGHGRLLAADFLSLSKVPSIRLTGLTDDQRQAYVIADNKLALNAAWDEDMLKQEIETLQMLDFDISLIGFNVDELAYMLNSDDDLDIDITEETYKENQNFLIKCETIEEMEQLQGFLRSEKTEIAYKEFEKLMVKR
jgi:ParB family transcriptional regulator, chromosome partitioning protein